MVYNVKIDFPQRQTFSYCVDTSDNLLKDIFKDCYWLFFKKNVEPRQTGASHWKNPLVYVSADYGRTYHAIAEVSYNGRIWQLNN